MASSLLVEFRKRLNDEILTEINEMIAEYNPLDDPQQISYLQDINLLIEARVNLENVIDLICYEYN